MCGCLLCVPRPSRARRQAESARGWQESEPSGRSLLNLDDDDDAADSTRKAAAAADAEADTPLGRHLSKSVSELSGNGGCGGCGGCVGGVGCAGGRCPPPKPPPSTPAAGPSRDSLCTTPPRSPQRSPRGSPRLLRPFRAHLTPPRSRRSGSGGPAGQQAAAAESGVGRHPSPSRQPPPLVAMAAAPAAAPAAQAAISAHLSVVQKTHSFFNSLKNRWNRSRSRERRRGRGEADTRDGAGDAGGAAVGEDSYSTDYAADNSSEYSSSATQSPRHRQLAAAAAVDDSPSPSPVRLRRQTSTVSAVLGALGAGAPASPAHAAAAPAATIAAARASISSTPGTSQMQPQPGTSAEGPLLLMGGSTAECEVAQRRRAALLQHSFYQLRVHLKRGKDLVARDKSGTSDPYVKFKVGGRLMHKSRTIARDLNPVWDESFTLAIEDPFQPIQLKVFDYDWGLQDDFMGSAVLDLTRLDLGRHTELTLPLRDAGKEAGRDAARDGAREGAGQEYMGELVLAVSLWPRTQEDREQEAAGQSGSGLSVSKLLPHVTQQYFQRNSKLSDVNRRLKSQIWSSVVTIVLVEGKNLLPMNMEGTSDPFCKFRLGQEKYKSKVAYGTLSPSWLEQFDLHMYDDQSQELEVTLWDKERSKDDCIGRCTIDLSLLERESTHRIRQAFDNGAGSVFLLLTISGTTASETISDLTTYEENPRERQHVEQRYRLRQSFNNLRDVGHLTVKVFRAQGLAAADLGGKSDPFCVLELVNARLQTQTEYKTLAPQWNKIFTFNVKDINSVLEVTVYDEDRDHKVEFLGRLAVPLMRIRNGEKRWYCLKDKNLSSRAKGNNPQILLEMTVIWNSIRASIRTINPKEKKYMQSETKFKRQVFVRNVMRLKTLIMCVIDFGKYLSSCFEWESTPRSLIALVLFILGCYYFEPYMVPLGLLCVFLKYYIVISLTGGWATHNDDEDLSGEDDSDDDDKEKEGKMSLKERLHAIQEVTQSVQNSIGHIASLGESIKNTFNFTVPFLSYLAILMLVLAGLVLYWVPARYLIMGWGINKFARKLIRPHTVPNNEVLDLLSRVPDDMDLVAYRELKPHNTSESERRREQRKKHKVN